ncbi:MAG TPA: hypothetical protein VEC93_24175 [Anaerolineae bacterium]|nr:hypothetical protein [Anaerolineae bacterium]
MITHRYTVRKINLLPLAKFGCLLGGVAMLLPGLICAVAGTQIIALLRVFLEETQTAEVDPLGLGTPLEFDFIQLLNLEATQTLITRLDEQSFVVALLIILLSVIGGGLLVALMIMLVGWSYNLLAALTGGLEVELRE